jgi:hypothetical protein
MRKRVCRMCGGEFNPVGRWDDPNVCRSCLTNQFCAGPATAGYEPEPARSLELRGRPRGGPLAHNQVQPGATPGPATNPPPAQIRHTTPEVYSLPIGGPPSRYIGPASVFALPESEAVQTEWWALLTAASHVRQAEILTNPTGQSARRLAHWAAALAEARS